MWVTVDKETIKETGNVLGKLTSSERWTFMFIMLCSLAAIVFVVWFYLNSITSIVDKYNATISKQQVEFLSALKQLK